jgi:hypothetical protein
VISEVSTPYKFAASSDTACSKYPLHFQYFYFILIAHLQSTQTYRVLSKWYGEAVVWREGGSIQ